MCIALFESLLVRQCFHYVSHHYLLALQGVHLKVDRKAIETQCMQEMLEHPSQCDYEDMSCIRLIQNCPIIIKDVQNACTIVGSKLTGLKEKR